MSNKELGPIFLTVKAVRGEPFMRDLKENIQKMRKENVIRFYLKKMIQIFKICHRHDFKILILSESHGTEEGVSGLTDKDPRNVDGGYAFYKEDCKLLGIKPGPPKRRLPIRNWNGVPDITKPAEKESMFFWKSLLQDMDIRVCNICYYHEQSQKLVQDIQQVRFSNFHQLH